MQSTSKRSQEKYHLDVIMSKTFTQTLTPSNRDAAAVPASAGRAGHLLERADWWMPACADLPPEATGRDQRAEAAQLQAER